MNDKNRSCPQCNAAMDFRLGHFDCPNCGHAEKATQPKPEVKSSGPGFQKGTKWGRASGKPSVPPSVAPPAGSTVYSPEADHTFGREETPLPKHHAILLIEKHVYFGLTALGSLISVLSSTFSPGMRWSIMGILESFFWAFIGLVVLAFVFYGAELWAKQCCMWWTVFQVLLMFGSFFFVSSMLNRVRTGGFPGSGLLGGGLAIFAAIITVAWELWLIWILYRDSKNLA